MFQTRAHAQTPEIRLQDNLVLQEDTVLRGVTFPVAHYDQGRAVNAVAAVPVIQPPYHIMVIAQATALLVLQVQIKTLLGQDDVLIARLIQRNLKAVLTSCTGLVVPAGQQMAAGHLLSARTRVLAGGALIIVSSSPARER